MLHKHDCTVAVMMTHVALFYNLIKNANSPKFTSKPDFSSLKFFSSKIIKSIDY